MVAAIMLFTTLNPLIPMAMDFLVFGFFALLTTSFTPLLAWLAASLPPFILRSTVCLKDAGLLREGEESAESEEAICGLWRREPRRGRRKRRGSGSEDGTLLWRTEVPPIQCLEKSCPFRLSTSWGSRP